MNSENTQEEDTIEQFSEKLNETISFSSTWITDRSVNLISRQIETDPLPSKTDQSSATNDLRSIETQTEFSATFGQLNEQKLANWLRDIYPMLEKELLQGITNVFDFSNPQMSEEVFFDSFQSVSAIDETVNKQESKSLLHGSSCWLSVSTQNVPLLAVASSYTHESWCNHSNAVVRVYIPRRNKLNSSTTYVELKTLPVKSCINSLETNKKNKDLFAGGTFSGDLYVWHYDIRNDGGYITERFSETSQFGSIVGIAWLKANVMSQDYDLLTCHFDGIVILWKISNVMIKDKVFKIKSLNDPEELAVLSAIAPISNNEFVVGTDNGRIILCSTSQSQSYKDFYDPIINDLDSHKFSVSTLIQLTHRGQVMVVTCDITGVVCFRWVDETIRDMTPTAKTSKGKIKSKVTTSPTIAEILAKSQRDETVTNGANGANGNTLRDVAPTAKIGKSKIKTKIATAPTIPVILAENQRDETVTNGGNGNEIGDITPTSTNAPAMIRMKDGNGKKKVIRKLVRRTRLIAVPSSANGVRVRSRKQFSTLPTESTPTSSLQIRSPIIRTLNMSDVDSEDESSSSDEEVSDSDDIDQTDMKKKAQDKRWILDKTFENIEMLNEFLAKESWWSYRSTNLCSEGKKLLYRCNRVKRTSKQQCEAGIYVIELLKYGDHGNSDVGATYQLYRKNALHTHKKSIDFVEKVSDRVKTMIIEQFVNGRKPKKISYSILDDPNVPTKEKPSYKQIIRIINNYKNNGSGVKPLTMRNLTEIVKQNLKVPPGEDEAFIVQFERSPKDQKENKFFRFFISTKRLLSNAANAKIVLIDSTHKVTTEKIPIIPIGINDHNNKFHFAGLTLANHEAADDFAVTLSGLKKGIDIVAKVQFHPNVLVCDGDTAIHNAFASVFGGDNENGIHNHLIIMCYFHVILNVKKKYPFKKTTNRQLFIEDVRTLHFCGSEAIFNLGCKLFFNKWRKAEPEATRLIRKSFFEKHRNWYIGIAPRVPKHNNLVENFNSTMKRCQTEHRRQPLKQFLSTAFAIVRQRSKEYLKDKSPFANDLTIRDDTMKLGRDLKLHFVSKPENADGSIDFFAFSSNITKKITLEDVELFENPTYNTFEDFKSNAFDTYKISFPQESNDWKKAHCSCPAFDTYHICKHIISIANSLGLLPEPESVEIDYDDEPLFSTQRGRPKKTSAALIID